MFSQDQVAFFWTNHIFIHSEFQTPLEEEILHDKRHNQPPQQPYSRLNKIQDEDTKLQIINNQDKGSNS